MTIVSMIVARWLVTCTTARVPDTDAVTRFCFEHFGAVPSQAQALAVRRALLALWGQP